MEEDSGRSHSHSMWTEDETHIGSGLFPLVLLSLGAEPLCLAGTSVAGGCQQVWPSGGHERARQRGGGGGER